MRSDRQLSCKSLRFHFDGVCALSDVSLAFPAQSITAIIGPNGAGKTTLLHVLTGFLRAQLGQTFFGQTETTALPPYRIARLGIARTFQDLRLAFQSSVLQNVLLARPHQRGERLLWALAPWAFQREESRNHEVASSVLKQLGLGNQEGQSAQDLSYGQQKLLSLAICIASEAPVLLLDEPVAGVDPEMTAKILGILTDLRQRGRTIIFVEHNIAAVRQIAEQVIVMDEGAVIAAGNPDDVLQRPEIMEAYLA